MYNPRQIVVEAHGKHARERDTVKFNFHDDEVLITTLDHETINSITDPEKALELAHALQEWAMKRRWGA